MFLLVFVAPGDVAVVPGPSCTLGSDLSATVSAGRSVGTGSVTPSELAQALHLDRSTVSGLLKRMERDGLLVRERHADNQRSVHVALTEYASGLRNELADIFTCVAEAMKLSEHDAHDLVTALHALRSAVRAQPTTTDVPSTEG